MAHPKRHHYVPEFILKGFADQRGYLRWARRLEGGHPKFGQSPPRDMFVESHLYSSESDDGVRDASMELSLAELETEASVVVSNMIVATRSGRCPTLTARERDVWYRFLLTQWLRVPESQEAAISEAEAYLMLDNMLSELRGIFPDSNRKLDALSTPEAKSRMIRNVRIDALGRPRQHLVAMLEHRGIAILHIEKRNKQFIIGSRPVVKLTLPGRTNLNDSSVEMWFPIASDIAVGVGQGGGRVSLHPVSRDSFIRHLNMSIARQISIIAASSEKLVRSIATPR
ncbi:DUF4238 domain-containing protein [Acidisoma cladoniae]|uniref:DUF4238 domain-containing protein n=1 Tax=Acidisoma cladoniae TaxID=3040935 RepID=UPI00254A1FE1|nr:DUF4238 domain-containing protein [Acidisoma sp. PAMC 29798]